MTIFQWFLFCLYKCTIIPLHNLMQLFSAKEELTLLHLTDGILGIQWRLRQHIDRFKWLKYWSFCHWSHYLTWLWECCCISWVGITWWSQSLSRHDECWIPHIQWLILVMYIHLLCILLYIHMAIIAYFINFWHLHHEIRMLC